MPRIQNGGPCRRVSAETMARIAQEFKARMGLSNAPATQIGSPQADKVGSITKFLFGGDFELDLLAYELRLSSKPLRLSGVPMAMLHLLVERRGRLVHRQEIVERIWGEGAVIDTDRNINETVRRIRRVLNENAEQPCFLQTVHGKGYRFSAPVVEVRQSGE